MDARRGTTDFRIQVLGPVMVDGVRVSAPMVAQALAALVLVGPDGARKERLADVAYDEPPKSWWNALRNRFTEIRDLGVDGLDITTRGSVVRLETNESQVDSWHLQAIAEGTQPWNADLYGSLLRPTTPLSGLKTLTAPVVAEIDRLLAMRAEVLVRHVLTAETLTPNVIADLPQHALAGVEDERLVNACIGALARSGKPLAGSRLAQQVADELRVRGVRVPDSVVEYCDPDNLPRLGHLPGAAAVEHLRCKSLVGRSDLIDGVIDRLRAKRTSQIIVLEGERGAGKTSTLAEIGWAIGREGWEVRLAQPLPQDASAFDGIASALPEIVDEAFAPGGVGQLRSRTWATALEVFAKHSVRHPFALLIDDAHDLDSASVDLLRFLVRSPLPSNSAIIVVTALSTDDLWDADVDWIRARPGTTTRRVEPLEPAHIDQLVAEQFPERPVGWRHHVVEEIRRCSGGLPALVDIFLRSFDANETQFVLPPVGDSRLSAVHRSLAAVDHDDRLVATNAAVLGRQFDLDSLCALINRSQPDVVASLERLMRARLIHEQSSGAFEFSTALVHQAADGLMSRTRRTLAHSRAADLADSPHRRARHLLEALPRRDSDAVVRALTTSAHLHLANGAYGEAATQFARAMELGGPELTSGDIAAASEALDRTGAFDRASTARGRAVDLALQSNDFIGAAKAATAGLPETEKSEGDLIRLEHLLKVPSHELPTDLALKHALTTSRQLALAGQVEPSNDWVERANAVASQPEHAWMIALAQPRRGTENVSVRRQRWNDLPETVSDPVVRLRASQFRAVDEYSLGHIDGATRTNQDFAAMAREESDPRSLWYSKLFDVMQAIDSGHWELADDLADEAALHGFAFGIADASAVRAGQAFLSSWLANDYSTLMERATKVGFRTTTSLLARVAQWIVLHSVNQADEEELERLVQAALANPDPFGLSCISLLAPHLDATPRGTEIAHEVIATVRPNLGTFLIVGGAVGNAGPFDRIAAYFNVGAEREKLRRSAINVADRAGLLTWRVKCRVEYSIDFGDVEVIKQAQELAGSGATSAIVRSLRR